jgi:hypothetical protein
MDKQSIIEILRSLAIGIALCIGVLALYWCVIARANRILRNWAAANNFELLYFKRCFFTGGFNPLTTSRNQIVYFVKVQDQEHHERSGWVRCGSFWHFIFLSNKAEVKWQKT